MESKSLEKLLDSIEKYTCQDKVEISFIVFMNNENYSKPRLKIFNKKINYLSLLESNYLNIPKARNFLHKEVLKYCETNSIKPIIWFLDEDMEVDQRVNDYLPNLHKYKKKYDVLVGSIEGDSPNASFSGINIQLLDLVYNLKYLDSLNDDDIFPNNERHNQHLREQYPDYYYDLSSKHSGHLQENFYIQRIHDKERVFEVKARIYSKLDHIISGQNIFRPIVQEETTHFNDTLLRSGNTFILNLSTLKIENPSIIIDNYTIRRSDMLWALINKIFLRKKIVKTNFVVLHNRVLNIKKELNIQKTIEENNGSVVFNALRIYYEENTKINFKNILEDLVNKKTEAIEKNLEMIKNNINVLKSLNKSELKLFIDNLEIFYSNENISNILKNIHLLKGLEKEIFDTFISYKPLILGNCILETPNNRFMQYDIDNEDIKIITKNPLESINKKRPVIRMHSSCCNSEVFGAIDCDCASQLHESMEMISKIDNGILFYLTQEGRGHGYGKKIAIVGNMQTKDIDTYSACSVLGLEDDVRDYGEVARVLKKLDITSVEIASNNPRKIQHLKNHGIDVQYKQQKLITHYTHENVEYLLSKQLKGKHSLSILNKEMLIERYPVLENKIEFYQQYDVYGGFSNFSDHPFSLEGKYWRTSEHYYQASKFKRDSEIFNKIQESKTPTEAKNIAHSNDVYYTDWQDKKILFMHNALIAKFRQNKVLRKELINTNNAYIVEKAVDDEYWGSGITDNGKNILGRLLMYVRDELCEGCN